jgi:hypothetical protein
MSIFYEKGRYRCRVTNQGLGKAEKGTPFFFISFEPLKFIIGPDQEEDVTRSYERTAKRYLTDKTMEYAIEDIVALGLEVDSPTQIDLEHPKAHSIVGNFVDMYCNHEAGEKGDFEKWGVARQVGGGFKATPIDRSEAKTLDAMFGSSLKTKRKMAEAEQPQKPLQQASANSSLDDDLVPF